MNVAKVDISKKMQSIFLYCIYVIFSDSSGLGGFASFGRQLGTQFGTVESRKVSSQSVMTAIAHYEKRRSQEILPNSFPRVAEEEEIEFDFGSSSIYDSSVSISGNYCGSKIVSCTGNEKTSTSKSAASKSSTSTSSVSERKRAFERPSGSKGSALTSGANGDDDDDENGDRKKKKSEDFDGEETLTAEEEADEELGEEEEEEVGQSFLSASQKRKRCDNLAGADSSLAQAHPRIVDRGVVPSSDLEEEEEEDGEEVVDDNNDGEEHVAVGEQVSVGEQVADVTAASSSEGKFQWRTSADINQDTFPRKSKAVYKDAYIKFQRFLKANGRFVQGVAPTEEDFQNYFRFLKDDQHFVASSLWCTSAKLNACLKREFGIKLQDFPCVSELLKSFDYGHVVKKAKIFSPQEVLIDSLLEFHINFRD